MVELTDGSVIAQLGVTDMRLPIQYAFSYPERWPGSTGTLDLTRLAPLEFQVPDHEAFPCLQLAYARCNRVERAGRPQRRERSGRPVVSRTDCFTDIACVIERALDGHPPAGVGAG
jgi:1-deoxy-D-xylulose-5-phosphate reductoisomerase